jgi:hypothetical protein
MPTKHDAMGRGTIVWLGLNEEGRKFSRSVRNVTIDEYGVVGDIYNKQWRPLAGHDGDYIETDGVDAGTLVLNMRPITIVDEVEVGAASRQAKVDIASGMLRENIVVRYKAANGGNLLFSQLPTMSRMVIQGSRRKTLFLTERNSPCRTITNPIALHRGGDLQTSDRIRVSLRGKRGQMAMVWTPERVCVDVGAEFFIVPPM